MLILRGGRALLGFRLNRLLSEIQSVIPSVRRIDAGFLYFVDVDGAPSGSETEKLRALLGNPGERPVEPDPDVDSITLLVTPRPGTISPWSSKATDIARHAGLPGIRRVERGIACTFHAPEPRPLAAAELEVARPLLHDRMTETVLAGVDLAASLFQRTTPAGLAFIPLTRDGKDALIRANRDMGLALSDAEIGYFNDACRQLRRDPTDVELMMFAQVNSEHCRHRIFNAAFTIDGEQRDSSLFDMIRKTHEAHPGNVLSAYHDNAAVMEGYRGWRFQVGAEDRHYSYREEPIHIVMKAETHNHPTAISPFPGAATGAGGEIRDEAATGRGARPKAGLTGFSVSNLCIPGFRQQWETPNGKPDRIVAALDIMLEGPIGAASYNNEFGRPALCGYFRAYEQRESEGRVRGYHKPIMLAGGLGTIHDSDINKEPIPATAKLVVLGGPAMRIGLGGGSASSMATGSSDADLDYASVQRGNAEMQRRCQEVIDQCRSLGGRNPILGIHDVGAGGLSNAIPELISASERGALLELRQVPNDEPGMSPLAIWCNESQERYVLAVAADQLPVLETFCRRERAPFAVLGEATESQRLRLSDQHFRNHPVDLPVAVVSGGMPRMRRNVESGQTRQAAFMTDAIEIDDAIERVLHCPTVAGKQFLVTIGDRSVSGLVVRDQMVGRWQVPVADCAVTSASFPGYTGEAMAIGERAPLALVHAPASGRMAVTEALLNIAAARILKLDDIVLSANWMAACGEPDQDAQLYATVAAVSEFCRALGIAIPVGKDSLSMKTAWREDGREKQVTAPLSVIVSAFARVADVRQSLTPELQTRDESLLLFIDLAGGRQRTGGSILAQVYEAVGHEAPDVDDPGLLANFLGCIQLLNESGLLLAYHDRSDGGLLVTLLEMAFTARVGLTLHCDTDAVIPYLFNEEAGVVIQVRREDDTAVRQALVAAGLPETAIHAIATLNDEGMIHIRRHDEPIHSAPVARCQQLWADTSYQIQSLRDNPDCAKQEYALIADVDYAGLDLYTTFMVSGLPDIHIAREAKPNIAILREQGINGQAEMAAAFDRAGFNCVDVHMQDLADGTQTLDAFHGLAACGGFSYGDVLGAGGGWARTIRFTPGLEAMFRGFFNRADTFALGVCNGCQMMSQLSDYIPGAGHWPVFTPNESGRFEARLVMVEVLESPSILLRNMAGSRIPIAVAHGEGRIERKTRAPGVLRYIDSAGHGTESYPLNPNGSIDGITAVCNDDGRFTIMMPHPERVFLRKQFSWLAAAWKQESSPWMQLFLNAREWLDQQ